MARPSTRRTRTRQPEPASTIDTATLTDAAVATFVTGAAFAGECLAVAGANAGAMAQTFAGVLRGEDTLGDGLRSALDAYGKSLRDLALLPRTYSLRFFQELEQSSAKDVTAASPARRRSRPSSRGGRPKR